MQIRHNKALHRTAIPLRSIAAGELGRSTPKKSNIKDEKNYEEKNKEEKP